MRKRMLVGLALLLLAAGGVFAQEPPAPAGKPGVTRPADDARPEAPPATGPKSAAPS